MSTQHPHPPPPETASSTDSSPFSSSPFSSQPFSSQPFASSSSHDPNPNPPFYTSSSSSAYPAYDDDRDDQAEASGSNLRPGTSTGRPTTSSGLRPGTANPFRQQGFQDAYGFNARPPTSGYGADNAGMDWDPYNDPYAASGRPRTSRSRAAGPSRAGGGVGGLGGAQGYIEEEPEYYDEEEEEESDDDGVFAWVPPTTAEQEAERRQAEAEAQAGVNGQGQRQGMGGSSQPPPPDTPDFAYAPGPGRARGAPSPAREGEERGAFAYEPQAQQPPLDQLLHPPPSSRYEPPLSPPSTESNSNDGSRAGMSQRAGEFRMTRLDGGRRSGEARRSGDERERRSGEGRASGSVRRKSGEDKENEGGSKKEDGDEEKVEGKDKDKDEGEEGKKAEAEDKVEEEDEQEQEPAHFRQFQPNPARSNANAGPYRRWRELNYNQAYPQYAVSTGVDSGSRVNTAHTTSTTGGIGIGTGPGRLRGPHGYGGDYEDRERWEEQQRRRRREQQRRSALGTAGTTNTNPNTGTGSEYPDSRLGTGESGIGGGYGYRSGHGKGRPGTGGISEVDGYDGEGREYESAGSTRKGSWYGESREWEDGEYEGESREGSIKMEFDFEAIEDEDSPYPEVRASVSNIDDPDMPAMTVRMWVVGLLLCMTSSAFNVFFNFRQPAPSIVPLVLLLLSYPVGKFMAFTLPITTYRIPLPCIPSRWIPSRLPRSILRAVRPMTFPHAIEFSLNPGPWNIKEHVLVYIMANVAVGNPYALNAIVVLEVYYEFKTGYWFSLVLVLATQLTGFGLAGMCRRFLVWPASMVWPQNLVACTLLNTLHAEDEDDGIGMLGGPHLDPASAGGETGLVPRKRGMSRYKFFIWTTVGSFFFFFLPGYLFEALSIFSFICWAVPNNVKVNQLFGVKTGLGMSVLTFDWTQISWIGSPLMVPWWAEVHIFAGFVLFYWIMTPILYYTNAWNLAYFPISANQPFDRSGNPYNIAKVLKPDGTFDGEAYDRYSPLFLPATYAVTYLLAFCLSTCVIVHTVLYHGQTLLNGFKKMKVENDDIHAKLMKNYPEVPDWWYASAFCAFFALAIVAVEVWDTGVPVWALLLSVLLPVIYILPSGFIYAMTGQGINLNILAQIIPGSLLAGQPLANMVFKAYSVQTLAEATSFIQDLKLGHYVKVPPRATFLVQLVATTLAAFIQVGVKQWIFDNVEDICSEGQKSNLTCPHNQVFYTASAVWGLIGPTRQFGVGSIYHYHLYAIVIGVFLPIPFWLWRRRYPNSWVKWVSTPVVLNGVSWIPPATGINYSSWFAVGVVFQYVVRKKNFAWWSKFNYVLSSALDSGTVIAVIVIFFTLQFPKYTKGSDDYGVELNWWGNLVHRHTADWQAKPLLPIPDGGIPIPNRS